MGIFFLYIIPAPAPPLKHDFSPQMIPYNISGNVNEIWYQEMGKLAN